MKRIVAFFAALVFMMACSCSCYGQDAKEDVTLLVAFHATWCGPCHTMEPVVASVEKDGYLVYHIDIDDKPEIAKEFGVNVVPTFLVLKKNVDGKILIVDRIEGVVSAERLTARMNKPTADMRTHGPTRQRQSQPSGGCPSGGRPSGGCPSGGQRQQSNGNVPKANPADYPSVVLIEESVGSKSMKYTGFLADTDKEAGSQIVVTCAHGYQMGCSIKVVTHDGRKFDAETLCVDIPRDLVVLKIKDTGIAHMEIEMNPTQQGEQLKVVGFANGTVLVASPGEFTGTDSKGDFAMTSCPVWKGCSGGPIINSKGKVVATVTGGQGSYQNQGTLETGPLFNCGGPCLANTLNRLKCRKM